jgi:hypothetical protein
VIAGISTDRAGEVARGAVVPVGRVVGGTTEVGDCGGGGAALLDLVRGGSRDLGEDGDQFGAEGLALEFAAEGVEAEECFERGRDGLGVPPGEELHGRQAAFLGELGEGGLSGDEVEEYLGVEVGKAGNGLLRQHLVGLYLVYGIRQVHCWRLYT